MKRKPISKKLRYEIFSRDKFACKYCGVTSEDATLHIDHIKPVCQGGTNDPENLITACQECNLGKGGRMPQQAAPTEDHRLMLAQERNEQIEAFETPQAAAKARQAMKQMVVNYWCSATGRDEVTNRALNTVFSFIRQHGTEEVFQWIDIAAGPCGSTDKDMIMYISGIRRNKIKNGDLDE